MLLSLIKDGAIRNFNVKVSPDGIEIPHSTTQKGSHPVEGGVFVYDDVPYTMLPPASK